MSEFSHVIAKGLSGQTGVCGCVGGYGWCWPRLQRGKCLSVLLVGGSGIQDPQPWDYLLSALFRICADGYLGMGAILPSSSERLGTHICIR